MGDTSLDSTLIHRLSDEPSGLREEQKQKWRGKIQGGQNFTFQDFVSFARKKKQHKKNKIQHNDFGEQFGRI